MEFKGKSYLVASLFITSLVGCGSDGGGGSSATSDVVRSTNCEFAYDEGEELDLQLAKNLTSETTNFGKKFHSNLLDAVGSASAKDTVKLINSLGVKVYKSVAKGCPMFKDLPVVTGEPLKTWKEATKTDTEQGFTAGLHIGRDYKHNGKPKWESVIIVRDDADRWTLVHEMMHMLFHKWETEEGVPSHTLRSDSAKTQRQLALALNAFKTSGSGTDFRNVAQRFYDVAAMDHEMLKRSALEESTIEDTLAVRLLDNRLRFLPNRTRNAWYLLQNLQRAKPEYEQKFDFLNEAERVRKAGIEVLDKEYAEVNKQLAELVVDSPAADQKREALVKRRFEIEADKQDFVFSEIELRRTHELLTSYYTEILELELTANSRADGSQPFAPQAFVMNLLGPAELAVPVNEGYRGTCGHIEHNLPNRDWLKF